MCEFKNFRQISLERLAVGSGIGAVALVMSGFIEAALCCICSSLYSLVG